MARNIDDLLALGSASPQELFQRADFRRRKDEAARSASPGNVPAGLFGNWNPFSGLTKPDETPNNEFGQSLARVSKNPSLDRLTEQFIKELEGYRDNAPAVRALAQGQLSQATDIGRRLNQQSNEGIDASADLRSGNRSIIDNFINRFNSAVPNLDIQTQKQTQTLQNTFGDRSDPNSVAAQQAGIRGRARSAEVDAILPQIESAILASQMRSGVTGVNKINDINLSRTALDLYRDNAVRNSARESRDLETLLGLQRSTAGLPQEITTTNLLRGRIPLDVRLDTSAREMGISGEALRQALASNAGTTSNIAQAYQLDQSADPLTQMARKLGVSNEILNQYLRGNFLSVAQEGPSYNLSVPPYRPQPPNLPYEPDDRIPNGFNPDDFGLGGGDDDLGYGPTNSYPVRPPPQLLQRPDYFSPRVSPRDFEKEAGPPYDPNWNWADQDLFN